MADSAGLREGVVTADWPVEATAQCARTNSANQRAFEIGFSVTLCCSSSETICLEVNAGIPCCVVSVASYYWNHSDARQVPKRNKQGEI